MPIPPVKHLWLRWVAANALGEMLGLGLTFAAAAWIFTRVEATGVGGVLLAFALAVASGAIEATIVGLAQWRAMRPWFPGITARGWWLGTLGGALLAYVLGYLPSTLMNLGEAAADSAAPAVQEPAQWIVLLLAAGMGFIAGAILAWAQWLVLRKSVRGAGAWIPANMLAWLLGMPLIFWGIDLAQKGQPVIQSVLIIAAVLLAAGAVVGAVHGAFLVRMAAKQGEL